MAPTTRTPLSGRPPKRKRSDAELQDLARAFRADWTAGDMVHTWIHKHEGKSGELSRMVEEGWLWEDISKAMQLAGITYSSGQPIPAHTLRLKAYLSRTRERSRGTAEAARQAAAGLPPVLISSVVDPVAPKRASARPSASSVRPEPALHACEAAGRAVPEEQIFRVVTLKSSHPPPKPPPPPVGPHEHSQTMKVPDEEILRRVFGKL